MTMGVRKSNNRSRRTELGIALEQSAKEILAHVKGDAKLPTRRIVLPGEVNVKRIRTKSGMSQAEFARRRSASTRERCRSGSRGGESPTQPRVRTSRSLPKTARPYWMPWRPEITSARQFGEGHLQFQALEIDRHPAEE